MKKTIDPATVLIRRAIDQGEVLVELFSLPFYFKLMNMFTHIQDREKKDKTRDQHLVVYQGELFWLEVKIISESWVSVYLGHIGKVESIIKQLQEI